ncbi:carboxypeptidase-like regulatory domain-containing protein, partial [Bacteroides congonensis]|uniref:carboxypeptidase-like regulatory domain-containing protein n=1 Tax=Bacteroides congonensis TaxID=1871006 RepID=UPI002FDA7730
MMKNCIKFQLLSKQAVYLKLFCFAIICSCSLYASNVFAQKKKQIVVRGKVVDPKGEALQDVLVDVKETLGFVLTDKDGRFTIAVPNEESSLIFTLEDYEKATVQIGKKRDLRLTLLKAVEKHEDRTVQLMYGTQKESRLVTAVETVGGEQIENIPVMFQNAAISGLMMGVQSIQTTGLPGADNASLYVRGQRSWRSGSPVAFVDGRPRSFSLLDPHEIESISVFKDAGSLSILGLRGSNGAFMATTRRGKEGKPVIRFNAQLSFSKPTQRPEYLDAYHYAKLYNEAFLNDNPGDEPVYKQEDLDLYLSGESPYTHPNVNWVDEILKKQTIAQRYNLSIQGGSSKAKYFVNFSYQNNDGLYKTDDLNTYNTNANFQVYSIRSNVDVSLTKDLLLSVDLFGRQQLRNNPGGSMSAEGLFKTLYSLPANIFPLNYGSDKVAGTNSYRKNPYGILNHSGYVFGFSRADRRSCINKV